MGERGSGSAQSTVAVGRGSAVAAVLSGPRPIKGRAPGCENCGVQELAFYMRPSGTRCLRAALLLRDAYRAVRSSHLAHLCSALSVGSHGHRH